MEDGCINLWVRLFETAWFHRLVKSNCGYCFSPMAEALRSRFFYSSDDPIPVEIATSSLSQYWFRFLLLWLCTNLYAGCDFDHAVCGFPSGFTAPVVGPCTATAVLSTHHTLFSFSHSRVPGPSLCSRCCSRRCLVYPVGSGLR